MKPPRIGKCTLVDGEDRLPKAHPLFQRRRLLEEVNHLRIVRAGKISEALKPDKRDIVLITKVSAKAQISFDNIRKSLNLQAEDKFNKESDNRSFILGDEVAVQMGTKTRFGSRWTAFSSEEQWTIIERQQNLESDADDAAFRNWLIDTYDLTPEQATATAGARLPTGFGRFGLTATTKLIHALTHEVDKDGTVLSYDKAVIAAGLGRHSDRRTGEVFEDEQGRPTLPYYGIALERHLMPGTGSRSDSDETRVGRLTNPTVHIALNQLRRVVRRLILAYGKPTEIVVELARDLNKSDEEKKEENQRNANNRREAEKRSAKLVALGQTDNGANRALLKLWEELDQNDVMNRRCVYSGTIISCHMLFSGQVQIDHILPYALTLDDSNANKLLCTTRSNQEKGKQSPFDRWGHTEKWPEIAERASHLPKNKRWRFEPDAMTRFDEQGGFLDRHLKDTQYLSRLAREYLETLYPERGENSSKVWVSPGRLTEIVRRKLGLNELLGDHNIIGAVKHRKNRLDHRHHAIDAVVVAIIDRSFLQKAQTLAGIDGKDAPDRIKFEEPWPGFRDDLRNTVRNIVVAHRPDHGTATKIGLAPGHDQTAGRLHNDTAYGLTGTTDAKGATLVVNRVPLTSLKSAEDIARVRDPVLRADLLQFTRGLTGKAFDTKLLTFSDSGTLDYRGIERVRIVRPLTVIPIHDATGHAYKAYKGDSNYRYDVWEMPDGKWITHWTDREGTARSSIVSMFDAHQRTTPPRPHPAARRVLSLQQDDVVAIEQDGGQRRLMRVVKFRQTGQVTLAEHHQGGDLKRRDATSNDLDDFKYLGRTASALKTLRTRQIRVDELGRVMDPGFPARKSARAAANAAE